MFANPSPAATARHAMSSLYTRVGAETAVDAASPHRLVSLLFDGLVEAIVQARGALQGGQRELKGRAIGRAVRIVEEGLKAGLNLEGGGTLAADLRDLYAYIGVRLSQANVRNDAAALDECQRLIEPLRSAWTEIGPRVETVRP
jgi:flagellar protein FliS